MPSKKRLDMLALERGIASSREKIRAMIMAGEVIVNGRIIEKPGTLVPLTSEIVSKVKPRFVSRGGEKLAAALQRFELNVTGYVCADVGASTGGFTDCLLQNGANQVYAIDVGYGQLAYTLRKDIRVEVMERTNARYLETLPQSVDLVTIDTSFISLKLLLPVVKYWLKPSAQVIPLIKPQFEAGREDVGKGGVVKDPQIHVRVIEDILGFALKEGFMLSGLVTSPLKGPAGNVEFLAHLCWGNSLYHSYGISELVNSLSLPR